jgi:hypothetical protein
MLNMAFLPTSILLSKARSPTITNHQLKALLLTLLISAVERLLDLTFIRPHPLQPRRKNPLMHHLVSSAPKLSTSKDHISAGLDPRNMAMPIISA